MAWFKKNKEVVDLTYLAKRGLVKVPQETEDYKDLSSTSQTSSSSESGLGFLGSLASSAESSPSVSSPAKEPGIKNKLEDFEFKIDTISKRVNSMMDRLDLVEKKLARDLRQGAI